MHMVLACFWALVFGGSILNFFIMHSTNPVIVEQRTCTQTDIKSFYSMEEEEEEEEPALGTQLGYGRVARNTHGINVCRAGLDTVKLGYHP
ncbi:hypothetical protein K435DRAFT_784506 [Dendrothele bispora CBS 962.96]|uniref:Uncharacterized protein n=1 Tax=Dendrothele bispora (strain CBS 962.96) TaxID=1314807 RepID=A0A4S8L2Q4_DENBC|nr:hypothetical protein K435DRAFT_784506 [Dendrothele bispora CBS 962.96]